MQKVVGGQLVNYEVLGEKNKKDLLVLHGWGGSLAEWRSIAESLSLRYKVWLVDFPGFGASPRPVEDWGIYEYAKLTAEFMKSAGLVKPIILGHSFGGRVAIVLGSSVYHLASKLILVDAAGMRIRSWKARLLGTAADYLRWLPQNIKNIFGSPDYRSAGAMRKIFVKTVNQNLSHEMTEIKIPTLIVWGDRDLVLPIWEGKQIGERIKNSVFRVVWGADHWPHLSKPNQFLEILEEEGI